MDIRVVWYVALAMVTGAQVHGLPLRMSEAQENSKLLLLREIVGDLKHILNVLNVKNQPVPSQNSGAYSHYAFAAYPKRDPPHGGFSVVRGKRTQDSNAYDYNNNQWANQAYAYKGQPFGGFVSVRGKKSYGEDKTHYNTLWENEKKERGSGEGEKAYDPEELEWVNNVKRMARSRDQAQANRYMTWRERRSGGLDPGAFIPNRG